MAKRNKTVISDAAAMTPPPTCISPELVDKIRRLRDKLSTGLVERELVARLTLLALIAGEHIILFGPPGTAKSLVAQRIGKCLEDASNYFERLLTRFSVPEEIFGPLSIKSLENDEYKRQISGYLPDAHFAFLDEIFKANSAILNSLLTILNERSFDNGSNRVGVPLRMVVGASNELPTETELNALFDRFLLRVEVEPVSADGFGLLLGLPESQFEVDLDMKLSIADLDAIKAVAEQVEIPVEVQNLLIRCREECIAKQIQVSDRRWRKVVKLLKVSAASNGRNEVSLWDCGLLEHCLWEKPKAAAAPNEVSQREAIQAWYKDSIGVAASGAQDGVTLKSAVDAYYADLDKKKNLKAQKMNSDGANLFYDADGNETTESNLMVPKKKGAEPVYDTSNLTFVNSLWALTNGSAIEMTLAELKNQTIQIQIPRYPYSTPVKFEYWEGRVEFLKTKQVLVPEAKPVVVPAQYDSAFVDSKLGELRELEEIVSSQITILTQQKDRLVEVIDGHLWVTSELKTPACASIDAERASAEILFNRVQELKIGFSKLPRAEENVPSILAK